MPSRNKGGCTCCDCPVVDLSSAGDWSGVDPGDGVALTDGFLVVTGEVEPASKITGVYTEAFLIEFVMRGTMTIKTQGPDIVINDTAGTVTIDVNSGIIPKSTDHSDQEYRVQVRVTPNHIYASVAGLADYGTSHTDSDLGVIVTADVTITPDGTFSIEEGEFKDLTTSSSYVSYDSPCSGYGNDVPIEYCSWTPLLPVNYRSYRSMLKDDGPTYMELSNDYSPRIFWPDLTYTGSTWPTGLQDGDTNDGCRYTATNLETFICDLSFALSEQSGETLTEKFRSAFCGLGIILGFGYEYGGSSMPPKYVSACQTAIFNATGNLSQDGMIETSTNALSLAQGVRELLTIAGESESPIGSGNWSADPSTTFNNLWPWDNPPTGSTATTVLGTQRYKLDPEGECGTPYPKPQYECFGTDFAANDVLSGVTHIGSNYTYSF